VKNLAFLLSVLVLLLATIPCCLADNCVKEKAPTEKNSEKNNEPSGAGDDPDCGICSPFYSCHTCPGFAFLNTTPKLTLVLLVDIKPYTIYYPTLVSTFASSIWQPPKIA